MGFLGAEMIMPEAAGIGPLFMVVQLLFVVLFVVVPLAVLIYVAVLLRRLIAAVQRIEQHLARSVDPRQPSSQ